MEDDIRSNAVPKFLSGLSIRSLLMLITSALGVLVVVAGVSDLLSACKTASEGTLVSRYAETDKQILQALQAIRQERGDTASALNLSNAEFASQHGVITTDRGRTEAALSSALASLAMLPSADIAPLKERLQVAFQDQLNIRTKADAALAEPLEQRDPAIGGTVLEVGNHVIAALDAATNAIDFTISRLDRDAGQLVAIKQYAWLTRTWSGNSVVILQSALAGKHGISAEDVKSLDKAQGRVAATWQLVLDNANRISLPAGLAATIDAVQNGYFSSAFVDKVTALRNALSTGAAPPMTMEEWRKEATARTTEITMVATTAMALAAEQAFATATAARNGVVLHSALLVISLMLVAGGIWIAQFRVVKPTLELTRVMRALTTGDLSVGVPHVDRRDEFGSMAGAVQVFKENAIVLRQHQSEVARIHQVNQQRLRELEQRYQDAGAAQAAVVSSMAVGLGQMSEGNLEHRIGEAFTADYEALRHDFNGAMDQLQDVLRSVLTNARSIRTGSGEISSASDDLSRRTEQQAASLEQTAAALDQITATVRKTAEGATQARAVVIEAKESAERSGRVVRQAVAAMTAIETSSEQITRIIGVIDEIAFQTNLLALNAGVEAARAGEAGRGFAVVASEVRALAQRSAEAAKEIKTLISTSRQQVSEGVSLVGQTGRALELMAEQVGAITVIMVDIAASAHEQSVALEEVNVAVNQMDQMTQQNAAMVEQTTAASHSLVGEARQLSELMTRFRVG